MMATSAHQLTTTSQHTSVSVVAPLVDYRYAQCLEKNSQNVFDGPPPSIHNAKNYLINKILSLWNCGICDESRRSSSAQITPAHAHAVGLGCRRLFSICQSAARRLPPLGARGCAARHGVCRSERSPSIVYVTRSADGSLFADTSHSASAVFEYW